MPSQPDLPDTLTEEEWEYLYRGEGAYRELPRALMWVTVADVFDDGLACTFLMAGLLHPNELRTQVAYPREPSAEELEAVREFFTLAADMAPHYRDQLRWVFAYSSRVPYLNDAIRMFPAVLDDMRNDWKKAARAWQDGEYMSYAVHLTTGVPMDYALAMYPIVEPPLRYSEPPLHYS